MAGRIELHRSGGPEVMEWRDCDPGPPGPGEVRVSSRAIGVNFIDVYHRSGLYPLSLPSGLGMEAVGVVEAVGEGVPDILPGARVATIGPPVGAYADVRLIPYQRVVPVPDGVDNRTAAAGVFKGLTAQFLLFRTYAVKPGDWVLIHAAAGGVGTLMTQWAKHLGANVIGTVGSDEKAANALDHGCDHAIVYTREDFAKRVREITEGRGVDVVYDSVGKDTFEGSLDCLRPLGLLASFGNASGPVPPFDPLMLMRKGSLFFTRAALFDYIRSHDELLAAADSVFEVIASSRLQVEIAEVYPLRDAAQAHRDLAARKTSGSLLLLP